MHHRLFQVFVFWKDGFVEDADEVRVFAADSSEADSRAREKWRLTKGIEFPRCKIVETTVSAVSHPPAWGRAR